MGVGFGYFIRCQYHIASIKSLNKLILPESVEKYLSVNAKSFVSIFKLQFLFVFFLCLHLHFLCLTFACLLSMDDLVVGAPMFMHRGSNGRLEELGKVYVYLQRGPLVLEPSQSNLLGPQAFSRFGTSLAPLGDLNQDGFNGRCDRYSKVCG